ncbi:MAG: HD domain-containing phosphohydrolase [Anaerolineae bacterium]
MKSQSKVLVVDDDQFALRSMARALGGESYEVVTAASGSEAIDLLKQDSFDLVLTDLKMPGVDGMEVLRQAREIAPQAVVLILTGYASLESAIEALREGAYDYLLKPCSVHELKLKIARGLERVRLAEERQRAEEALRKAHDELEIRVKERTAELAKANEELRVEIAERKRAEEELRQSHVKLRRTLEGTVNALVSAIEMGDPYTAGHQRRVTQLACAIAKEMGLPEEQIEGIRVAGLIHDLGKINVPAQILSKPGPLTGLEYGLIKMHPQVGHDVLKAIEFPWPVAQIVLQHHERVDGSGYPEGLLGEEIILEARILGVADVVEAMASERPYRPARSIDEALEEISQNRGVLYDPQVVDACLKLFTEKGFTFEEERREQ